MGENSDSVSPPPTEVDAHVERLVQAGLYVEAAKASLALSSANEFNAAYVLTAVLGESALIDADAVCEVLAEVLTMLPSFGGYASRVLKERGFEEFVRMLRGVAPDGGRLPRDVVGELVSALDGFGVDAVVAAMEPYFQAVHVRTDAVGALLGQGQVDRALSLFNLLLSKDREPPVVASRLVVRELNRRGRVLDAVAWIDHLAESGVSDLPGGTIIEALVRQGLPDHAEHVLGLMATRERPIETYHLSSLVRYFTAIDDEAGLARLSKLTETQGLSVKGYLRKSRFEGALGRERRLMEMLERGENPAQREFVDAIRQWGSEAQPERAEALFEEMLKRHTSVAPESYGVVLAIWRQAGRMDKVEHWFTAMRKAGIRPTEEHINHLLTAMYAAGASARAHETEVQLRAEGLQFEFRSPLHSRLLEKYRLGVMLSVSDFVKVATSYAKWGRIAQLEGVIVWLLDLGYSLEGEVCQSIFHSIEGQVASDEIDRLADRLASRGFLATRPD